jgi:hypothetical protein
MATGADSRGCRCEGEIKTLCKATADKKTTRMDRDTYKGPELEHNQTIKQAKRKRKTKDESSIRETHFWGQETSRRRGRRAMVQFYVYCWSPRKGKILSPQTLDIKRKRGEKETKGKRAREKGGAKINRFYNILITSRASHQSLSFPQYLAQPMSLAHLPHPVLVPYHSHSSAYHRPQHHPRTPH